MSQGGVLKRLTLLQKFCLKGKFPPDRLDGDIVEEIATQRQVEIDAIVA